MSKTYKLPTFEENEKLHEIARKLRNEVFDGESFEKTAKRFSLKSHSPISRYEGNKSAVPLGYIAELARLLVEKISPEEQTTAHDRLLNVINHAIKVQKTKISKRDERFRKIGLRSWSELEELGQQFVQEKERQEEETAFERVSDSHAPNIPQGSLHQRYLRKVAERVELVNLAQINEDEQHGGIKLEKVYVDSPTSLALSVEVKDWRVIDWWLSRSDQPESEMPGEDKAPKRTRPEELGYERAPFETLVGEVNERIERYREANPNEKPDERYYWLSDGFYENKWSNRVKKELLHLNHLATAQDRLVILGAPGSGKSTFVKYLCLCLAGSGIEGWNREANLTALENWTHGALTPVYVELRRFVASDYFPKKLDEQPTAEHLLNYIDNELLGKDLKGYREELAHALAEGRALVVLDGLDEVPYPKSKLRERQVQLINLAESLHTRFAGSRVIVTSRPYSYQGWSLPGYEAVTITEYEEEHRLELANRLYRAMGLGEEEAEAKAEGLNEQLKKVDKALKDRPLFVTLLATLYLKDEKEGLPSRKGALYQKSIWLLLERWTKSRPGSLSLMDILGDYNKPEELYMRLAELAYDVHSRDEGKEGPSEIGRGLLFEYLSKQMDDEIAGKLVPYLSQNAGVLVSLGQDRKNEVFCFAHRSYQEYLAAEHMVKLFGKEALFREVASLIKGKPERWRVPCAFVGDVLANTGQVSGLLWQMVGEMVEGEPPERSEDPRWWLGWLGARVAEEQELYKQEKLNRLTEQPIREALVKWLVALMGTRQALGAVERAECGRALGLLGDPRKGVGTKKYEIEGREEGLPELEWCEIGAQEGGKFVMGAESEEANPRREVGLGYSYRMSKYLITYQQYQTFAESGEYEQLEWWKGFPSEYQPQELREQYNEYANHPRERVSWYQAVAFTRWLGAKYRALGWLKEGEEIRLPREVEWEYAGRGKDERKYPYGNEYDATKGNTRDTGIGETSAVGSFPDGASPFGVLDMSGNVWEWCQNKYQKPSEVAVDESNDWRVVRGGSYDDYLDLASCAFRSTDYPSLDRHLIGFRVVVCSANAPL